MPQCRMSHRAGMMLRKTLEVLCDLHDAKGVNLHQRLEDLGKVMTLPSGLSGAMLNLKLLGNDAAHVNLKDFVDVGEVEIKVGIKLTLKLLEAAYQYQELVADLEALKKPAK